MTDKRREAEGERALALKLAAQRNLIVTHDRENLVKIDKVSFHPSNGRFYQDGCKSLPERGAEAFISYVQRLRRGTNASLRMKIGPTPEPL